MQPIQSFSSLSFLERVAFILSWPAHALLDDKRIQWKTDEKPLHLSIVHKILLVSGILLTSPISVPLIVAGYFWDSRISRKLPHTPTTSQVIHVASSILSPPPLSLPAHPSSAAGSPPMSVSVPIEDERIKTRKSPLVQILGQKKDEILLWIDTLNLPEKQKLRSDGKPVGYSKEILREDFTRAYGQCISDIRDAKTERQLAEIEQKLPQLRHALEIFLGLVPPDTFRPCGIPNYTGINCFLNTALQILVHTQRLDYPLLMPPKRPERPAALDEEIEEVPVPQKKRPSSYKPDFSISLEERGRRYRQYQADFDHKAQEEWKRYDAMQGKKCTRDALQEAYTRDLDFFEKKQELQKHLSKVIFSLRSGIVPDMPTMATFLPVRGVGGETGSMLSWFSKQLGVSLDFRLSTMGIGNDDLRSGILEKEPWKILAVGSGGHLWSLLKVPTKQGEQLYEINDSQVVPFKMTVRQYVQYLLQKGYSLEKVIQG